MEADAVENTEKPANTDAPITQARDTWWVRFIRYTKRKVDERAAKKQKETPTDRAARVTANATLWIAIFTFVSVAVSVGTFLILKSQLREMHEGGVDTHTLAEAAKKQAEAAQQALRDNTDAFRLDEQARFRITSREAGWHKPISDNPLTANYHYKNVGKTPGELVAIDKHVAVVPFRNNVGSLAFKPEVAEPIGSGERVLFPGDEQLFTAFNSSVSTTDQRAASNGTKLIVSWGCIEYRDVFRTLHWTDFCDVRQPAPNAGVYATCAYQCAREQQTQDKKPN